jgi:hypothetical protein
MAKMKKHKGKGSMAKHYRMHKKAAKRGRRGRK